LLVISCVSASLDDDLIVKNQLDLSSSLSLIPDQFSIHATLKTNKDFDISKELKKFEDRKFGLTYSIALMGDELKITDEKKNFSQIDSIVVTVVEKGGSSDPMVVVNHVLTDEEKLAGTIKFATEFTGIAFKRMLESGPVTIELSVTGTFNKTFPSQFENKLFVHVAVFVENRFF